MPRFQFVFLVYSFSMATIPIFVVSFSRDLMDYIQGGSSMMWAGMLTGATMVLLVLVGLLLSNRIAGPLYRIARHLSDLAEGKAPAEIKLREGDYFKELADAANALTRKIESK